MSEGRTARKEDGTVVLFPPTLIQTRRNVLHVLGETCEIGEFSEERASSGDHTRGKSRDDGVGVTGETRMH